MSISESARQALSAVTTATLTTVLLKKGLRNVWMRGARPLKPGQPKPGQLLTQHTGLPPRAGTAGKVAAPRLAPIKPGSPVGKGKRRG